MKARKIGYWVATVLVAASFIAGGFGDLVMAPQVIEGLGHLGYPAYFAVILGAWKVLGGAAILVPRLPLLKEWAYAGMVFDLTGASMSHAAVGDPADKILVPVVLLGLVALSWWLRPATRKVAVAQTNAAQSTATDTVGGTGQPKLAT